MLKWIFSLGVEHERNRVKRLLSELGRDLSTQTQYWQEDPAKASEKGQKMKQQTSTEDNLTEDLRAILEDDANLSDHPLEFGCMDTDKLLEQLVIYIVHRDHKILEHGIKVGKDQSSGKS